MKCQICSYDDQGTGDGAHHCRKGSGPVIALPVAADRSDDLSMLVVRLARALDKAVPGHDFSREAMDYLKRNNLHGSPLRDMPADRLADECNLCEVCFSNNCNGECMENI